MLEGSVRKSGEKLRINAQLVNTSNGVHVWAERYDRRLDEMFAVQDEVTRSIVRALSIKLSIQEESGLAKVSTNSIAAYEHFLLGQKHFFARTRESHERAKQEYIEAIKLDPGYARSYGALAVATISAVGSGWDESPTTSSNRALELALKAVSLNDNVPEVYWALGYVHLYREEFELAKEAVKKAIIIAPNYADAYGLLALIHNHMGNGEEAVRLIMKGMKLNPHYTWDYPYNLGRAYYTIGEYEKAIKQLRITLERNENVTMPRLLLAASLVALGQQDDAEWEIEQAMVINPSYTITHISKHRKIENAEVMTRFITHLRKAGIPE